MLLNHIPDGALIYNIKSNNYSFGDLGNESAKKEVEDEEELETCEIKYQNNTFSKMFKNIA
jgi:hypothetical protein